MTELAQPSSRFREIARGKLGDAHTQAALDTATNRLRTNRVAAWEGLPDVEAMREHAHQIKMSVIDDLDGHVARFTEAFEARGGKVFFARTGAEASEYVARVCRDAGAKLAAKSKSMATEEIGLNEALSAVGVTPVETDLGEYILQLAGEHPVHIIAPAIEKTAEQVAELLSAVQGERIPPELEALTSAARTQLRETFLNADVGITGANFGVSSTGSICLVTNEGNARLVSRSRACTWRSWGWSGWCRRPPTLPCCSGCWLGRRPGRSSPSTRRSSPGRAARGRSTGRRRCMSSSSTTGGRTCFAAGTARCWRVSAVAPA